MEPLWKSAYPPEVPLNIDTNHNFTMLDLVEESFKKYKHQPCFSNMGSTHTYGELDRLSGIFCSYLQNHTSLKPSDRFAIQLPNVLQFFVAAIGAMRAGLVLVNTNPLYTERELLHQFTDSGARGLVVLANMAQTVEKILAKTTIESLIVTELGDMLPLPKKLLANFVVKHIKKMVPPYHLPSAIGWTKVLEKGKNSPYQSYKSTPKDIALLQYTGGTTGLGKGAMITHHNLASNVLQAEQLLEFFLKSKADDVVITPLPLYHIFSFTINGLTMMKMGNHNILITNPRDIPAFVKELKKWKFTIITGLNTLFAALCKHPNFSQLDFSHLKMVVSGGMALQTNTANEWTRVTGNIILEGYGLTEASPLVSVNFPHCSQLGSIGIPVPSTQVKLIDDDGNELPMGKADTVGELCISGPQVMAGYWNQPEETQKTLANGWLKTGDLAQIQPDGIIKIVDRKKDMIIVSGFNVYPNEIEDVISAHPMVVECAVIGIPDLTTGQTIKLFVVPEGDPVELDSVVQFCQDKLTRYKIPKEIENLKELPKSNVGKVLRRELKPEKSSA